MIKANGAVHASQAAFKSLEGFNNQFTDQFKDLVSVENLGGALSKAGGALLAGGASAIENMQKLLKESQSQK